MSTKPPTPKTNNTTYKQTNHLSTQIDKQADKGKNLPRHLLGQFELLQQYSKAVREILAADLPEDVLNQCWVVNVSEYEITLSVGSVTLSNHLRYMNGQYVQRFKNESTLLAHVNSIKVIVTHTNQRF